LAGEPVVSDPVNDWQQAAFNYEYAAEAQESAAHQVLLKSRFLRNSADEDVAMARRNKVQAANMQLRAADLMVAAAGNLENASRVWRKTASVAGRETASGKFFTSASQAAASKALCLVRQAVELCEQAAVGFAVEDDLLSQAAANQKAAGLRERLAKR
jgi:hypothetical protein